MKNKKAILSIFFIIIFTASIQAQQTVKGQVWDEVLNEPLVGVSVLVKGTSNVTITDIEGVFNIKASTDQTLVFNYIGYLPVEIVLTPKVNLNRILMKEKTKNLDEVVVVGYGVQKKTSTVGAISQTKGEDLLKVGGASSVSQALQGIIPGVVSMNSSSKPGADAANILIRGKGSWVSSAPLYLIDGVERNFDDIDPNEIETLSVLKDASATAVYGVKGANGVILITTKRGSKKKTSISFSANFGAKQPTARAQYADYVTTMQMWNEAQRNDNQWGGLIPESTINAWSNAYANNLPSKTNPYFPAINWQDELLKDYGVQQQYNINVSGGTDFVKFFTSLGYLYDGDIFKTQPNDLFDPAYYYRRYNWRTNFDFNLTRSTILSIGLSGKMGTRNQAGYRIDGTDNTTNDNPQFYTDLYSAPQHQFPITWADGSYGVSSTGLGNLLQDFNKGERMQKYYQNFIDVSLKQDLEMITKGLNFGAKLSYNAESNTSSYIQRYVGGNFGEKSYIGWYRTFDYTKPTSDGGYQLLSEKRWVSDQFQGDRQAASYDNVLAGGYTKKLYYELALNYARSFGDHNFTGLALLNRNENQGLENSSASQLKFQENDEGWVTRLTYNWKERYFSEFNGAYTGSQKFARGKRFQFFPSYSVGWRISEEPLVKKYIGDFLDNLKVRYSYGIVGYDRSAAAYTYIQTYSSVKTGISLGDETAPSTYGPLYVENQAANVDATWETATKQNFGIDLKILNRLSATLDFYSEHRDGILMQAATPAWFGITNPDGNIGITKSRGYEFELNWSDKIGKDFRYWIKGNYSFNENRVVFRNDAINIADYLKAVGKPIGTQTRLVSTGFYKSLDDIYNYSIPNNTTNQGKLLPGDLMYIDFNADGVITDGGDKIPLPYTDYPQQTYGASLGFNYKGFEINAMFYGVFNMFKDVAGAFIWDLTQGSQGNYYANPDVLNRWTYETTETATKPVLHSVNSAYSQRSGTTFTFMDASYLRLKNLEASYTFDSKILKAISINKLQIYISGNNLLTFTKFNSSVDPESNSDAVYPLVKRYNLGIRMTL